MPTKVAKRAMASLRERYERDYETISTADKWGEWVNSLPVSEFMALVSLREPPKVKPAKAPKLKNVELCKRLVAIAAFHIEDKKAQMTIYEAVRALQR